MNRMRLAGNAMAVAGLFYLVGSLVAFGDQPGMLVAGMVFGVALLAGGLWLTRRA